MYVLFALPHHSLTFRTDDPEFPVHKANYRDFLLSTSNFHQPIPIRDETIQRKIHHTYRLQFMKDVVLARALDDSTFNVLNSCIIFNQIDIINHVQHDVGFLREVVGLYVDEDMLSGGGTKKDAVGMKSSDGDGMDVDTSPRIDVKTNGVTSNGRISRAGLYAFAPPEELSDEDKLLRNEVVFLIQQLCAMGKNVQLAARMTLFRTLVDRGILFAVQWALALPEKEERLRPVISAAGEVLAALLDHDLIGVRGHVLKQIVAIEKEREAGKKGADKADTILALMCKMMAQSREQAVQCQVGDALKVLLEITQNEGPEQQVSSPSVCFILVYILRIWQTLVGIKLPSRGKDDLGTEKFLDYFYKGCIELLFKPFSEIPEFKNLKGDISPFSLARQYLIRHLTFAETLLRLTREKTNLFLYLCDLLCNFTQQHSFRSHFFILSSNISPRVASLLSARDKHLRLGKCHASFHYHNILTKTFAVAFRYFRICLKLNNRNLTNHLIKSDIMKPLIDLTVQESRRDNLLSSSCREFFEHLRRVRSRSRL
jgi:protein phosphatase-4 regulatory subunit 3